MTSNQIAYKEAQEKARSNRANEELKGREVREKEKMGRHTRAKDVFNSVKDLGSMFSPKINDIGWYNKDAQLLKDVAQVSFNNPLGNEVKIKIQGLADKTTIVPGIMTLWFQPSIGGGNTADIAAKSLYSYVRHANSGSRNYEAPDLMMYLLATTECYSYFSFMSRIYSLIMTSKSHNRYYVDATLSALGIDSSDIRNNIANFRAYINSYRVRVNSLFIPKNLPYMLRHMWLNGTIFKDSPVKKSQIYMFAQHKFLSYDDVNGRLTHQPDNFTGTNPTFSSGGKVTFAQLQTQGNCLIDSLLNSEDAGIMSGDILKAYGESNMAMLPAINEDFHIEAEYSELVLSQIHNSFATNYGREKATLGATDANISAGSFIDHAYDIFQVEDATGFKIVQGDPAYLKESDSTPVLYAPVAQLGFQDSNVKNLMSRILNFWHDDVSPEDIMEATRLIPSGAMYIKKTENGETVTNTSELYLTSSGSEILIDMYITRLNVDGGTYQLYIPSAVVPYTNVNQCYMLNLYLSNFDRHPRVYPGIQGISSYGMQGISDLNNYAVVDDELIAKLNYVAILSEFGIPDLGLTVRTR